MMAFAGESRGIMCGKGAVRARLCECADILCDANIVRRTKTLRELVRACVSFPQILSH